MKKTGTVLFVEDDSFDQDLITRAIVRAAKAVQYHFVNNGEEAVAYLTGQGKFAVRTEYEYPSFIVTDVNMPNGDGFGLLEFMQRRNGCARVPIVVLSSSPDAGDIQTAYQLSAAAYLVKPVSVDDLERLLHVLLEFWTQAERPPVDQDGLWVSAPNGAKVGERFTKAD